MSVLKLEQLKPFIHRLDELLSSSESWGELALPLDRSLEILRGLLQLSSSFPALETSHEVLYQNANRIFENGIGIVANIAQFQAGILQVSAQPQVNVAENSAQFQAIVGKIFEQRQEIEENSAQHHSMGVEISAREELCSLLCLLQEFLPELKVTEDLCLRAVRTDLKMDALCECHLARHLRVIINILNSMHELLVFLKSVFIVSGGVSVSVRKFTKISSKLEEIVSVLAESNVVSSCAQFCGVSFLSVFFRALDKPFKIAMNALWLLFLLTTIDVAEFETILVLCRSAARIFVCSIAILNDLTQIFLKDFSNFKVLRNELAQHTKVVLKCIVEMFPPKVNGVTVFQNMCSFRPNGHVLVKSTKNNYSDIVPQNSGDSKNKNHASNASMQFTKNLNGLVPQEFCSIKCNGGDVSLKSTDSICDVTDPQGLQDTKYKNVDASRQLSKKMNSVILAQSLYSSKSFSGDSSVKLTKNICDSAPSNLRNTKNKNVGTSMQPTKGINGVIALQSLCNTKCNSGDTSVKTTKNECDMIVPVSRPNTKDKNASMQPTKNMNGVSIRQTLRSTDTSKNVCNALVPLRKQDTKCVNVKTSVESTKNMNGVSFAQTLCNIKPSSRDIFSAICDVLVPLSLQDTKYRNANALMQSTKNTNDIVTQSLCNVRCDANTSVQFQSIPVLINLSEDTSAVLKTIFAIITFSQSSVDAGFNAIVTVEPAVDPVLNKFRLSNQYLGTWGLETCSLTLNQGKVLVKLVNRRNEQNNLVLLFVKAMKSESQVVHKVCDTTAFMESLAASAHFFHNSPELKFAFLEGFQKQCMCMQLENGNFLLTKNNKLLFFCHFCGISVTPNKVLDHVRSHEHLRSMSREVLNNYREQNNNCCGIVTECKNSSLFGVSNKLLKDSCATVVVKNLARAKKIRSQSWASSACDLRKKIPEPKLRAVSLSRDPGKGACGKILNVQELEALDPSHNHAGILINRRRASGGKIAVGANECKTENLRDSNNISLEGKPIISAPTIVQDVFVPKRSSSCAQNILQSVSQKLACFTSQNSAQNTIYNAAQCSLQNCVSTARTLAQSDLENFESPLPDLTQESIYLDHDSFCRIFDSLSLEDQETVRKIVLQIKDEINNFALSNKPGTSKLRMVCKLCCHPIRPHKVVSHVSKPSHLQKLEQSRGTFRVTGVERPVEADGAV